MRIACYLLSVLTIFLGFILAFLPASSVLPPKIFSVPTLILIGVFLGLWGRLLQLLSEIRDNATS